VSSSQIAEFGLIKENKKKKEKEKDAKKVETISTLSVKMDWLFATLKKTYKKSIAQKNCILELQNLLSQDRKHTI
jgi:hypothetical protein